MFQIWTWLWVLLLQIWTWLCRSLCQIRRWLCGHLHQIRRWLLPASPAGIRRWLLGKVDLETENVAGRFPPLWTLPGPPKRADQTRLFQPAQLDVQRGARDFGIGGQLVLRRKAAGPEGVPVAEMPKHKLGCGEQSSLLDRPVGGQFAHSAAVAVRRLAMDAIRAMRASASAWRI